MESRMDLSKVEPKAYEAIIGLEKYLAESTLDQSLKELVKIRASQINGCAFCLDMHTKDARKNGETEQRIYGLDAWRESPFYSDKERAAFALTDAVTLVSETHVPDEVYEQAKAQFGEQQLAQLLMAIATINVWNRIAITTRMMPEMQ